jgi:hypothetical protein
LKWPRSKKALILSGPLLALVGVLLVCTSRFLVTGWLLFCLGSAILVFGGRLLGKGTR